MEDLRICPECGKEVKRNDMIWTNDRYGIPFKLVCGDCYDKVQNEILQWKHDYFDAGEYLEPEDAY